MLGSLPEAPMATSEHLPPGTSGLPLLGETLPFMKDMFGFIRARSQRHGPVFRSHILGTPTAFISALAANHGRDSVGQSFAATRNNPIASSFAPRRNAASR